MIVLMLWLFCLAVRLSEGPITLEFDASGNVVEHGASGSVMGNSITSGCTGQIYDNGTTTKCFWVTNRERIYAEADQECKLQGGDLATIEDYYQGAFVHNDFFQYNSTWVKMVCQHMMDMTGWNQYCFRSPYELCPTLVIRPGYYDISHDRCTYQREGLCEHNDPSACKGEIISGISKCFWKTYGPLNYTDAATECKGRGGELAVLGDPEQVKLVTMALVYRVQNTPSLGEMDQFDIVPPFCDPNASASSSTEDSFLWTQKVCKYISASLKTCYPPETQVCPKIMLQYSSLKMGKVRCSSFRNALCESRGSPKIASEGSNCTNVTKYVTQTIGNIIPMSDSKTITFTPIPSSAEVTSAVIENTETNNATCNVTSHPATVTETSSCTDITRTAITRTSTSSDMVNPTIDTTETNTLCNVTPHPVTVTETSLCTDITRIVTESAICNSESGFITTTEIVPMFHSTSTEQQAVHITASRVMAVIDPESSPVSTKANPTPELSSSITVTSTDVFRTTEGCSTSTLTRTPLTPMELKAKIEQTQRELMVKKNDLSATKRKRQCATDSRISCLSMGLVGIAVVVFCFVAPVFLELPRYYHDLRRGVAPTGSTNIPRSSKIHPENGTGGCAEEIPQIEEAEKSECIDMNDM